MSQTHRVRSDVSLHFADGSSAGREGAVPKLIAALERVRGIESEVRSLQSGRGRGIVGGWSRVLLRIWELGWGSHGRCGEVVRNDVASARREETP